MLETDELVTKRSQAVDKEPKITGHPDYPTSLDSGGVVVEPQPQLISLDFRHRLRTLSDRSDTAGR